MNQLFYDKIANSTAHRPIRDELSAMVLRDKNLLPDLVKIAIDVTDKNHHKACWVSELVFENKIDWLQDYLDAFCDTLEKYTHESAIRPVSKICLFAADHHYKGKIPFLNGKHLSKITETCFDWLIDPKGKVATKAYSMRTLYILGKKEDWIYPELENILPLGFPQHTAAYKSAAKDILQRIEKSKKAI
ncbi:hypothetical protein [Flavobacterium beibuense]|uniref:Adenylosuccinate lyase n=1 Tax=Flavobacterium beibuense TaxID=657326 RepID=A0A444WIB8_9FLAO|nr:hypothetical protein [Flavobacterium beibuense]RYJ45496.1 Adenylosuccinate lyase [Flavobacterium beibuense]